MALIDEVKTALAISLNDADIIQELNSLIDAAKEDLIYTADISAAVVKVDEPCAMIRTAIIAYVKAHFTDDPDESEKYMKIYNSKKVKMSVSSFFSTYDE